MNIKIAIVILLLQTFTACIEDVKENRNEGLNKKESVANKKEIEDTIVKKEIIDKSRKNQEEVKFNEEEWCLKDFWRFYDEAKRDTMTIFNDHSLCIEKLPQEFYNLKKLKIIKLDTETSLIELSSEISNFTKLEELLIQKSKLKILPKEIGQLKELKKMTIAWGGGLTELPEEIGNLEKLEYLDLYRNDLKSLPESIKNLKKLKYLRLGENKFSEEEKQKIKNWLPECKVIFSIR